MSNSQVMDYCCVKDCVISKGDGLNLSFSNDGFIAQERNEPRAVKIGATLLLGHIRPRDDQKKVDWLEITLLVIQ